jgi:hypothetical protein
MATMEHLDNLSREDTHTALRFLLYRMNADTRGVMMAQMPVTYMKLFPSVSTDVVLDKVRAALGTIA